MASHGGEANSYYNQGNDASNKGYPLQPQMQYPPQTADNGYQHGPEQKYQQPPPNYGQDYQNTGAPPMANESGKQSFDQAFKLDKPKYNDLWAGILVCLDRTPLVNF